MIACYPCVSDLPVVFNDGSIKMSIEECFKHCLDYFDKRHEWVMSKNRKRERVLIRQMCIAACKTFTTETLENIGYFFWGRDHTTVIHSVQTLNNLCDAYADVKNNYENLKLFIKSRYESTAA